MDVWQGTLLAAFGLLGALVGWAYSALMRHSLAHVGRQKRAVVRFAALACARVLLFGGGLLGALLVGGWCLIPYALGFIVARTVVAGRPSPHQIGTRGE